MRGSRILVLIETVDKERNLRFPNTQTVGHATAQALPRQPIKMQGSSEFVPLVEALSADDQAPKKEQTIKLRLLMDIRLIKQLIQQVKHQRVRCGVKDSGPGTYLQFIYKCKPDCIRCALDKALL